MDERTLQELTELQRRAEEIDAELRAAIKAGNRLDSSYPFAYGRLSEALKLSLAMLDIQKPVAV